MTVHTQHGARRITLRRSVDMRHQRPNPEAQCQEAIGKEDI